MKKFTKSFAVFFSACILMSSCMGSFGLTKSVYQFNETMTSNKFVNEVVFFVAGSIVYSVTLFADCVVFNSIEFWTGNNPIQANVGDSKIVKNANGEDVTITTTENGYNVSNGETAMNLIFDEADNSWSIEYNNQVNKLMSINGNNAQLYLLNGQTVDVTLDAAGVNMARQLCMSDYAMK